MKLAHALDLARTPALALALALFGLPAVAQICAGKAAAACYVDRCIACHALPVAQPSVINSPANATAAAEILTWGAYWPQGNRYAFTKLPSSMNFAATAAELDALADYLGTLRNAAAATPTVSSTALGFALTAPGQSATTTVDVNHTLSAGNWSLLLRPVFAAGSDAGFSFSVDTGPNCLKVDRNVVGGMQQTWYAVRAAGACRVNVSYTRPALPTQGLTPATGVLTLEHNTAAGSTAVALSAPPAVPSAVPAALDFGPQTVAGVYPARTVTVTANGATALAALAVSTTGKGFASTHDCPPTLAVGASCTISTSFVAPAVADFIGEIVIASNAVGSPRRVALSARGTASMVPVLEWSQAGTSLVFGDVTAGTLSPIQSVSVVNRGPGGMTVGGVSAGGANASEFRVDGSCFAGAVLFQGDSCRIDVALAPASAGTKAATLEFASTGSTLPMLTLTGVGLPGIAPTLQLSTGTLAFGLIEAGMASVAQTVVLRSTGVTTLHVASLSLAVPFVLQGGSCAAAPFDLPPGGACTLDLAFAPADTGPAGGALAIVSDSPGTASVNLEGFGAAPPGQPRDSGGGCSIVEGATTTDPVLWLLVALAALLLWRRRTPGK